MRLKTISSIKFISIATIYFIVSIVVFLLTTGSWYGLQILFLGTLLYLLLWISIALLWITSRQIRYSLSFICCILFVQTIAILFNIREYGIPISVMCKNWIQEFFDSTECIYKQLWMSAELHVQVVRLYSLLIIVFVAHVFWLRFGSPAGSAMSRKNV
jgi:hypothetical protein